MSLHDRKNRLQLQRARFAGSYIPWGNNPIKEALFKLKRDFSSENQIKTNMSHFKGLVKDGAIDLKDIKNNLRYFDGITENGVTAQEAKTNLKLCKEMLSRHELGSCHYNEFLQKIKTYNGIIKEHNEWLRTINPFATKATTPE